MAKITLNDKASRHAAPVVGRIELWDKLLPGFGLRITAGGARTYFVMRRLDGTLVRRTVGKAPPPHVMRDAVLPDGEYWPHEARERARRLLSDLARGIDPDAVAVPAEASLEYTFGGVAESYFKDPAKRGGARLKSRPELERKVRVDLAAWKDRCIAEITRADIKAMIATKRAKSPVSANRLLALIQSIFRWATREEIITANPALEIESTEEIERERVLTMGEIARIWAAADVMGYPFGPLIKLLILTAQRRSEVAGLSWHEIDGAAWKLPDARAKRGKGHLVPLSPLAVRLLAALPRMDASPLVFTTGLRKRTANPADKAEPVAVSGWSRMKNRLDRTIAEAAAKAANEPLDTVRHSLTHWTLHDLRRSAATHLRDGDIMGEDRVDRLVISKVLNHAEGGMTRLYDRYAADPEKRRALEAWATRVERLCGLNVVLLGEVRA